MSTAINALTAHQNAAIDKVTADTTALAAQSKIQLITMGVVALLLGLGVATVITRRLLKSAGRRAGLRRRRLPADCRRRPGAAPVDAVPATTPACCSR